MASGILGQLLLLIKTKGDTSGLDKTDKALKKTSSSLKKMSGDMGLLSGLSKKLMGGLTVGGLTVGFNRYLQFEKDLGAIHSRFFTITKDEHKAVEEFDYIRKIAKETANDIKATADSYSIFYSATSKTLGKEGAREVFEDWTKVGRVLHLSEFQMERVTYALREMASKGAIYSQDLRMQIGTHVPNAMGLAQKAAEELGFTGTDWFEKLQKAAKGNATLTTQFVKLFSKYAKQEFGSPEALKKALQQPDSLAQMIKNMTFEFGYKVSQAGGKDFVVSVLRNIYDLINNLPLDKLAENIGATLKVVGKLTEILPELLEILKIIAFTYLARFLVRGIGSIFNKVIGSEGVRFLAYHFKGGFKSGFLSIWNVVKTTFSKMFSIGGGTLLKYLGGFATKFVPIVGTILLIYDILKVIGRIVKKRWDNVNKTAKEYLRDVGVTDPNKLISVAKNIDTTKIKSQEELNNMLARRGYIDFTPYIHLDEKHNVVIKVDDKIFQIKDAEVDTDIGIKEKSGKFLQSLFPQPKPSAKFEFTKELER